MKELAAQVKTLATDFRIARIIVMQGNFVYDVAEFNISEAFIKSGKFASHVRNFLDRSKDLHVSYEVCGVSDRRYGRGD